MCKKTGAKWSYNHKGKMYYLGRVCNRRKTNPATARRFAETSCRNVRTQGEFPTMNRGFFL